MFVKFVTKVIQREKINRHLINRHTHTWGKPDVLEVFSKGFSYIGNLKNHFHTHTWEEPDFCELCNKEF